MSGKAPTPVMAYWKLSEHPFRDSPLSEAALDTFACREKQLADLMDALDNPLVGVYGSLGVGKTSFLNKVKQLLTLEKQYRVLSLDFAQCMGTNVYRELLRIFVRGKEERMFELRKGVGINVKNELERLDSHSTVTTTSKVGGKLLMSAEMSRAHSKGTPQHTEETARSLVRQMVGNIATPLVVLVDDLEKVKYFLDDRSAAYLNAVSAFTATFKDVGNDLVSFVLTLDDHFAGLVEAERAHGTGALSFSFGELLELPNFQPHELVEVLRVRLVRSGWRKSVESFISPDVLWVLYAATGGHPRKCFAVLREAMKRVHRENRTCTIDHESLAYGMAQLRYTSDETDLAILKFLLQRGPASPSDRNIQKAVKLSRRQLGNRLNALTPTFGLQVAKASATSGRMVYSLPSLSRK